MWFVSATSAQTGSSSGVPTGTGLDPSFLLQASTVPPETSNTSLPNDPTDPFTDSDGEEAWWLPSVDGDTLEKTTATSEQEPRSSLDDEPWQWPQIDTELVDSLFAALDEDP